MNDEQPPPNSFSDIVERVERIEHVLFDPKNLSSQECQPYNEKNKLNNMKLHDIFNLNIKEVTSVLRVAGGWLYIIYDCEDKFTTTFVPFDNEFMRQGKYE